MIDLTWSWIAIYEPALDVSNTVAIEKGVEHDLWTVDGEYGRWATAAARSPGLQPEEAAAIARSRPRVADLRAHIRAVFRAAAAGDPLPRRSVAALNEASRAAPQWPELDQTGVVTNRAHGGAVDRLLAAYARSAIAVASEGPAQLRVCGAPSCGMFYRPNRRQQRWCSESCGNRARFARHYARHGST